MRRLLHFGTGGVIIVAAVTIVLPSDEPSVTRAPDEIATTAAPAAAPTVAAVSNAPAAAGTPANSVAATTVPALVGSPAGLATADPAPVVAPPIPATADPAPVVAPPIPATATAAPSAQKDKPEQLAGGIAPSFDVVRINPQGGAVMAGRSAPGAEVSVLDGDTVIGRTTADAGGEWVIVADKPLPPVSRTLSLTARAPGSQETIRSSDDLALLVPEPSRDSAGQPLEGLPSASLSPEALAMIVPKAGGTPAGPLPVPRRGPDGSATATPAGQGPLALDIIEYDAAGRLALAGRADPGATLNLYLGDQLIGQVKTGADGKWSSTAERDVAPGLYQLRIDKVQPDGKVAGRLALPIRRAEPLREGGRGDFVVVQPGNSLWRIARHSYGAGIRYALIYTANRDQIGNPALIYPGQIFKLPVVR